MISEDPPAIRAQGRRWGQPRVVLDPLAALLRQRFDSRAELARASGLGYQMLRTYTDGLWTAEHPPPPHVLDALGRVIDPEDLGAAVRAALAHRSEQATSTPPLTWGQRVVLEALRGFDDARLVAAAPHVYDLVIRLSDEQP